MNTPTQRKQKQRDLDKQLGIKRLEIKLSKSEREKLEEGCIFRGGYDANEYIATLIRRDNEQIQAIKNNIGTCPFCEKKLPSGCDKSFKGHRNCFYTRDAIKLSL